MGIGGAGMSPLAEMALLAGVRVTGCDSSPGPATQHLEERGATVWQGHDASHVAGCAALVMTAWLAKLLVLDRIPLPSAAVAAAFTVAGVWLLIRGSIRAGGEAV